MKKFTGYQKFMVAILAFLQFTIILDFMILSPLGAVLMPALSITPAQFGLVVSAYAFSAGISGLLAAGFTDRYDRKKLLLFFYVGFVVGTLMCGIAPNFQFLLLARVITGLFGGVIGSIVFAITTDLFSFELRGRVMGYVQTAFAGSQILGIPLGLYLSNHWGWHAPFMMIVGVSIIVGFIILFYVRPIDQHLKLQYDNSAYHHLKSTVTNKNFSLAFAATALLSIGGYLLMPFGSAFSVHNLGVPLADLPLVYLVPGICSIVIGPMVGKLSDKFGKFNVFTVGSLISLVMVLIYTNLGITPLFWVIVVNTIMFVGIFSRMIPSQALMSAIPGPAYRGSFMAVSSSLQQIAGGFASVLSGMIVVTRAGGTLEHFDTLGYIMLVTIVTSYIFTYFIHKRVNENPA